MSALDLPSFWAGGAVATAVFLGIEALADWLHGRRLARSPEGKS